MSAHNYQPGTKMADAQKAQKDRGNAKVALNPKATAMRSADDDDIPQVDPSLFPLARDIRFLKKAFDELNGSQEPGGFLLWAQIPLITAMGKSLDQLVHILERIETRIERLEEGITEAGKFVREQVADARAPLTTEAPAAHTETHGSEPNGPSENTTGEPQHTEPSTKEHSTATGKERAHKGKKD